MDLLRNAPQNSQWKTSVTSIVFKGLFDKLALEREHSNISILSSIEAPFIKKKKNTQKGGEINDIQMTMFLDSIWFPTFGRLPNANNVLQRSSKM